MEMSEDYKLYLDERFNGVSKLLNAQFEATHERIDLLTEQVKKTNGRVTEMEKDFLLHPVNCPNIKTIEQIEEEIKDVTFFSRHPKIGIGIAGVFVFLFIFSMFTLWEQGVNMLKSGKDNTEQIMNQADSLDKK